MTLTNRKLNRLPSSAGSEIVSYENGTKQSFAKSPSRFFFAEQEEAREWQEKTKNRRRRYGKENCLDLLGWVRDVALAWQKIYTPDYDLFFMIHLF